MHDPIFLAGKSDVATKENWQAVKDLLDTLLAHKDRCVGMAANMIGVKKRISAFLDKSGRVPTYTVMLNSEIINIKKNGAYNAEESRLSLLGGQRPCKRYKSIKVKYQTMEMQNRIKTCNSWTVQIIQHEVDHCDGVLI